MWRQQLRKGNHSGGIGKATLVAERRQRQQQCSGQIIL